jgi:hypothetical protein
MQGLTGLRAAAARIGLPVWFTAIDVAWIADLDALAWDARHYQRAATEWLAGGNPWSVTEGSFPYAAGPHTLLFYAPTSVLPLEVATWMWMGIGLGAALWAVRWLRLPVWWVLFPPLAHAIWNGNPQTLVVLGLVAAHPLGSALAAVAKLYALVQLFFRPRHLLVAALALVLTAPFVPWLEFLRQSGAISAHLGTAWDGSAWRAPVLVPLVVLALWVLRRHGGEWLSIPALWPATQFYYVSTVLPLAARRPLIGAVLALPAPLMVPIVALFLAGERILRERRSGHDSAAAARPTPPAATQGRGTKGRTSQPRAEVDSSSPLDQRGLMRRGELRRVGPNAERPHGPQAHERWRDDHDGVDQRDAQ